MPDTFGGLKLAATPRGRCCDHRRVHHAREQRARPGDRSIASTELRPEIAIACIFVLMAIGIVFFFAVSQIERFTMPWHLSVRRPR